MQQWRLDVDDCESKLSERALNSIFVQLFSLNGSFSNGSVFQTDGTQRLLLGGGSKWWYNPFKNNPNIKFLGCSVYNVRHIRYDGILLDCLGEALNVDINNLVYLSGDLYLRADGTLFESTGGKYEEESASDNEFEFVPRICYVNAERLSEFKEKGEIGGKKVNIIRNEIIKIVEKWTLPDSYIGFLVLEVEQDIKLSITNLEIPYKLQKDSLFVSTGFVSQNKALNKKNSIYVNDKYTRKSFSFDELMMFPFCITSEILIDKTHTQDKTHELFNNSNHIVAYYDISEIRYKTNGSDKWQSIRVKSMESVVFFE